ncbi:zinc transport system permease protein [Desulfacinum hydrothermale DSM 13146]|uniref:Zinc transport system permease protein n=1 Tax=Desulfacinum hydrothermale DSM 13146 TaxID=1121390 RepID=A0A1W1XJP3_9BACT|nr:iron chelate uptake ABC transporter family permease subunit [Desulfacinum hydrothermale]SMC23718.1 zinc transport system permease protein [Desulfacinum hydrothermale DSM 13146]
MSEWLQLPFVQNALLGGLLAGILCGIMGTYVVANRIAYLAGGIAHAAYGGVGLALFFGLSPLLGVLGFTLAGALIMGWLYLRERHRADTAIGVLWAFGMAVGVLFTDLTPGYNVDLMSYLFGSILAISRGSLAAMAALIVAIGLFVICFYRDLAAVSYDDEFARARGIPVTALQLLLIVSVALSVVVLIRVVGLILVIALLTIAPYMAEKRCRSLASMMVMSSLLNCLFAVVGLGLSIRFNVTSGPAIICVASLAYFAFMGWLALRRRA